MDGDQHDKDCLSYNQIWDKHDLSVILPFDRLQRWIHCICLVTFDIELGQAIEVG